MQNLIYLTKLLLIMFLSIIIPVYNEEKRIVSTLEKITFYLNKKKYRYEIIIVDDGSTDRTRECIKKFKKIRINRKRINKGKGYSVREGILMAKGDYMLFSDADLSTPIEELEAFRWHIKKYDVVIASRNLKESDIKQKQPFYRILLGKAFPLLVNLLAVPGIKDTQCGFKLFTKKAVKVIFPKQTIDGFGFDVEILFIAKKSGLRIKELPVVWINDTRSKVSVLRDPLRMLFDVLKIRINSLTGKY